jgi:plastocyanin
MKHAVMKCFTLLAAATFVSAADPGAVKGLAELPAKAAEAVSSQRYSNIVGQIGKPKEHVGVVWLEGEFPKSDAPPATVTIGQRDYQFEVAVAAVPVGAKVLFPNHDDAYHNVFSYSKAKRFDLGRYLKSETPPAVVFDKPGVIQLYCEIHEHMRATIVVVDSPYYTTTDADGNFRLENLPPGRFRLKAWLGRRNLVERDVAVSEGRTLEMNLAEK